MISNLEQLVTDVCVLHIKLILLVGVGSCGKTKLLRELGARLGVDPLNVGLQLGRRLAATPVDSRAFAAGELLREIADNERPTDPLLLDNMELLFEHGLRVNPLDLVKRLAHSRRVVAVWPGELRGDRLIYADMSHPEHREFNRNGAVIFEVAR